MKEGGDTRKCKEGSDKLSRELKKLDNFVNYGSKKAFKEVRASSTKCLKLSLGMLGA